MKALFFAVLLATASLVQAGNWEWHHAEQVWVNDDGSWHYKNGDKLVGAWKDYVERERARDHIELGSLISHGVRISCVYLIRYGQDTEVHLIFPDGREIEVTVQVGTSTETMDAQLQQIADELRAP